ncbi:hypothetical protein [Massilia sp. H6]|uniref:hypothetical protein n=1 Tax=Massilia sp. H6 TaxID=2970464 RepID=UPI00216756AA|nr:hypothetical protein [Massilia sp. H6]UVW28279.1 hypothetical protein NRS07_17420 [Massilia sp. H6]
MRKLNLGKAACKMTAMATIIFGLSWLRMAHGGEPESVEQVLASTPMPCAEEATLLMNRQLLRMAPDQILSGMQQATRTALTPGGPSYNKARAIVTEALASEEEAHGPLFKYTPAQIFKGVIATWGADEKSYYSSFFSSPSGKLYLTDILDGATCKGWLKSLNSPPFSNFHDEDKARWETSMARLNGGEERFLLRLRQLTKEERKRFEIGYKKLDRVFDAALMQAATRQDAVLKARIEKALQTHAAEILKTINTP